MTHMASLLASLFFSALTNILMCELLLASLIVGAVETTPGTMTIDQLKYLNNGDTVVETIYMKTNDYLDCWR